MKISIYSLSNPTDGIVRYIGRTKGKLNTRLVQHCSDAKFSNNKRTCWIKSVLKTGVRPVIELIDEVDEDKASFFEKHYIKLFKSFGAKLVNDTEGGEGVSGRKYSEEEKKRMSLQRKGRQFSEEHKKNLSISNARRWEKGFKFSEQARKNIIAGIRKTNVKPILMFDSNNIFIKRFESIRSCEREIGLDAAIIVHILKGRVKKSHYIFKYAD